jgi:hypothetical protein
MANESSFIPTGAFPDDYFPEGYFPDETVIVITDREEKYDFFTESRIVFNVKGRQVFCSITHKRS